MSLLFFILFSSLTALYGDRVNNTLKLDSVKYALATPSLNYNIKNEKEKSELIYTPESATYAGFSVSKYGYSIGASFVDPLNKEEIEKGKERSNYFDIYFKKTYSKSIWELYYQHYSGYKLQIDNEDQTELLGIESIFYGVKARYFLKDKFNAIDGTGHNSNQKKTMWSTFYGYGVAKNIIQSNQSLIPKEYENTFEDYKGLRGIDRDILTGQYGICGQYIFHGFYAQGLFALGMNLSNVRYQGSSLENTTKTGPSYSMEFNLGHQFKNSLLGLEVVNYILADQQNDNSIQASKQEGMIYYNYFF